MKKVSIARAGAYDQLRIVEAAALVPGAGEVRVDVAFAGVNYADCVVRMGLYESAKKYVGWPITPGFEVAGTVGAVGPGVDPTLLGAEVFAVTRFGGYASQVVVPRGQVFARPARLSLAEAAAFPAVHMTAHVALFELAHPRPGERVLVHSAAGGVGSALVQLARSAGCHVTAVVGASAKVAAARALGADEVIDRATEDLWRRAEAISPRGFDVVLDANGVSTLDGSYRHTAPMGRLVVYGFHSMMPRRGGRPDWGKLALDWLRTPRFNPLSLTTTSRSVLAFNLSFLFDRTDLMESGMARLLAALEGGALRAPTITVYPFERVAEAHAALESGRTVGKLVLAM
jgi:NADPH:quinone reductase-like Zn-dependent oxidoreductase